MKMVLGELLRLPLCEHYLSRTLGIDDLPFNGTLTYGQTEFVLAGSLKRKNDITRCYYNLLCRYELRRQDSNMRPPGYEPGELPTAPLRDIN